MPLTYRDGVIKIQTARTRMQGLDKAVTAQRDRSPHIKREPVSRQTDQTEETTKSTSGPQSEPASPGRRRRDTCDSEDPVAHFAANAPWKCYVGRKRRVFWLFRDQIATRSDFLLAQMNNSETQELYLEEL
ncbi:hypothetical protein LTR70_001948 [Exophiala xenobiotica]|uniref:Uncharacterized protein n=1 Tax=Lithohypha guttulata TaxID=1690604 RepID=A0ABR0K9F6_9EURO|nr:hypothetical protein LTR24_005381 [Lithohypha guttulata]KAK5326933.1 hypothetical protein LTR70_001948 [Exophiala xenobiotica]